MSTSSLNRLSVSFLPTEELLQDAFHEWIEASDQERIDYLDVREGFARNHPDREDLIRVNGATHLYTSGYTSGERRRYQWGPCFTAMAHFFEWLKFRHVPDRRAFVFLFPSFLPGKDDGWSTMKFDWAGHLDSYQVHVDVFRDPRSLERAVSTIESRVMDRHDKGQVIYNTSPSRLRQIMSCGAGRYLSGRWVHVTGERFKDDDRAEALSLGIRVLDGMRCWDGGMTFIECEYGHKHWIDMLFRMRLEDGEAIVTDLFNLRDHHHDYRNGDVIEWKREGVCSCGLSIDKISFADRSCQREFLGHSVSYKMISSALEMGLPERMKPITNVQFRLHPLSRSMTIYSTTVAEDDVDVDEFRRALRLFYPGIEDVRMRWVKGIMTRVRGKLFERSFFKQSALEVSDEKDFMTL